MREHVQGYLTSLSERFKENAKSSRQLGEKHPSPRFNTMAVRAKRGEGFAPRLI
jgi:hypothetical protein